MKKIVYGILAFAPVLALAQNTAGSTINSLTQILNQIKGLLNTVVPVLIGLAVIYFFWGVIVYLRAAGDPKALETGKSHMIWGIIAIAVMVSIFGLVSFLQSAFGLTGTTVPVPTLP